MKCNCPEDSTNQIGVIVVTDTLEKATRDVPKRLARFEEAIEGLFHCLSLNLCLVGRCVSLEHQIDDETAVNIEGKHDA